MIKGKMMIGKFRVWATSDEHPNGRMYYIGDYHTYPSGIKTSFILNMNGDLVELYEGQGMYKDRGCSLVWARIGFNDIDIMFFTGFRNENNGKEIYGKDIIRFTIPEDISEDEREVRKVIWVERMCAFQVRSLDDRFDCFLDPEQLEVIGNIYENPELIKINEKK